MFVFIENKKVNELKIEAKSVHKTNKNIILCIVVFLFLFLKAQ